MAFINCSSNNYFIHKTADQLDSFKFVRFQMFGDDRRIIYGKLQKIEDKVLLGRSQLTVTYLFRTLKYSTVFKRHDLLSFPCSNSNSIC